jgi:hypothetical protein
MNRTTLSLVAILFVLAVAAYLLMNKPGELSSSSSTRTPLAAFDSSSITSIEVIGRGFSVKAEKATDGWRLVAPVSYRADNTIVGSVLSQLHSMTVSEPISSNPGKFGVFNVDSSATLIRIRAGEKEILSLRLGKPNDTYTDSYVRKDDSHDVVLAGGMLGFMVGRSVNDWRDKTIVPGKPGSAARIGFSYGDTSFVLARGDSGWTVNGMRTDDAAVKSWFNSFAGLQADGFIDSSSTPSSAPRAVIAVDDTQIQFYAGAQSGTMQVRTSASPQWFEVRDWRTGPLLRKQADFMAK